MDMAISPDSKLLALASWDKTVKLWDTKSGATLETLKVDKVIRTLSFSDDGTFLQTNRGPLRTAFLSAKAAVSRRNLRHSIFIEQHWISRGTEHILWLPSEHRPTCVAVHGSIVAFGYPSGRVTIIEFAF
jgi:WD40 repeat protein